MAGSQRRADERAQGPVWALTATMAASALALGLGILRHWGPFSPRGWISAGAAVSVASLLGLAAISSAIALTEGRRQLRRISEVAGFGLAASVVTTSMALATVTLMRADPRTLVLVII